MKNPDYFLAAIITLLIAFLLTSRYLKKDDVSMDENGNGIFNRPNNRPLWAMAFLFSGIILILASFLAN